MFSTEYCKYVYFIAKYTLNPTLTLLEAFIFYLLVNFYEPDKTKMLKYNRFYKINKFVLHVILIQFQVNTLLEISVLYSNYNIFRLFLCF